MSRELTDEEFDIQMGALAPRLKKYAHLLVREGLGLTEGQELVVEAAVEAVSFVRDVVAAGYAEGCLLYTSPSPRDGATSRMPSSA